MNDVDFLTQIEQYAKTAHPLQYALGHYVVPWMLLSVVIGTLLFKGGLIGTLCLLGFFSVSFILCVVAISLLVISEFRKYRIKHLSKSHL